MAGLLHDVSGMHVMDAAATAFAAALAAGRDGPVLWVQDHASRREGGVLYEAGLRHAFGLEGPILQVRVGHPRDALRAMEEGLGCNALAAVVGEVDGRSPTLDMVATQRLAFRAKATGVPAILLRGADAAGLSAARARWRLASAPAAAHPHDPAAPGCPRWRAALTRAKGRPPGEWTFCNEGGEGLLPDQAAARSGPSGMEGRVFMG
ncbi:hypothetical protein [Hasllibacter halocynthiae]|uniref:hypothetical protein n=1 Tax=Hasllibacter halocynthiae TaxID=595589 RepID=UPI0011B26531|nr:hypothetical protein [Hasllibacter halocynthiae]